MSRNFTTANSEWLPSDLSSFNDEPLTLAIWLKASAIDQAHHVISIADSAVSNQMHRIFVTGATNIAKAGSFGSPAQNSEAGTISIDTWHHLCGVFTTGSSRLMYLDGVAGTENTETLTITGLDRIGIGCTADSTQFGYVEGDLAEGAVWSAALTATEVASLAKGYSPRFVRPGNLVFYAPLLPKTGDDFDHVGGLTLNDTNTVQAASHPRTIYPSRSSFVFVPAATVGHPTMRRWGGIPHMHPHPGRSW